ncbi:MAG TPA: PDZ domain-containing protein [Sandaracinaceae bacterium]
MARDREEFDGERGAEGSASDRLSSAAPIRRRAVHPYRERRDALIARRRSLVRQLEAADRAARRRDRLARELARIDAELCDAEPPPIDAISIPTPCSARWEDTEGAGAVRHCPRCDRDAHHHAPLARAEVVARAGGPERVRSRRRPDGHVAGDPPPARPHPALRALGAVAIGALFGAGAAAVVTLATLPLRAASPAPVALLPAIAPPSPPPAIDVHALRSGSEEEDDDFLAGEPAWPAPKEPAPLGRAELDRHVRWIAPQAWELDRVILERALAPGALDGVRAVPPRGRSAGVRVLGVRRHSLLGRLGLQNGDTIVEVNGHPLGPSNALELLARLADADALFVRIRRRGEERVHVYRIVG